VPVNFFKLVIIWQRYGQKFGSTFLWLTVNVYALPPVHFRHPHAAQKKPTM